MSFLRRLSAQTLLTLIAFVTVRLAAAKFLLAEEEEEDLPPPELPEVPAYKK
jgi:hypothetical protein